MHTRFEPSFLRTITTGDAYGDVDLLITPILSMSRISFFSISLNLYGMGYGLDRTGSLQVTLTWCLMRSVVPGKSVKICLYSDMTDCSSCCWSRVSCCPYLTSAIDSLDWQTPSSSVRIYLWPFSLSGWNGPTKSTATRLNAHQWLACFQVGLWELSPWVQSSDKCHMTCRTW